MNWSTIVFFHIIRVFSPNNMLNILKTALLGLIWRYKTQFAWFYMFFFQVSYMEKKRKKNCYSVAKNIIHNYGVLSLKKYAGIYINGIYYVKMSI